MLAPMTPSASVTTRTSVIVHPRFFAATRVICDVSVATSAMGAAPSKAEGGGADAGGPLDAGARPDGGPPADAGAEAGAGPGT